MNLRPTVHNLVFEMSEEAQSPLGSHNEESLVLDKLKRSSVFAEVFYGIGIMLGLSLLWALESARNASYRVLDKMNIKPRIRHASAFPPGSSREHTTIEARR